MSMSSSKRVRHSHSTTHGTGGASGESSSKSGKTKRTTSSVFSGSSCSPANFQPLNIPPTPKIGFNEYRFTWFISDYEIHDYLRADHPRRIISRKFRTQIEEPAPSGMAVSGPTGESIAASGTIRNCYWRASFSFCGDGDDHRHLHIHCSSETGVDVLCLVRIFNKTGENLIGTYYQFDRVRKHLPIDFRLDSKSTREMERRRRRSEVSLEIVLIIISGYEDGTGVGESLMEQVRESEKLQDYTNSDKRCNAGKLSRCYNARKQFEQILMSDGNHFSDITLVVGGGTEADGSEKMDSDDAIEEGEEDSGCVSSQSSVQKFYCHRYLLSQESPVFERMFTGGQGFIENQNKEVTIDDVEPEVMREFLHFVYTGTLEKAILSTNRNESKRGRRFVESLIQVAEKYQVENLKRLCELRLLSTVNNEQMKTRAVVETLVHSHCFNLYRLREILLRFVAWHSDVVLFGTLGNHIDEQERAERSKLIQSYPDLHIELTKLLASLAHKRCPELEMEDSLSDNDSSGASSDRFSYSSDDSTI